MTAIRQPGNAEQASLSGDGIADESAGPVRHRADYILERGVWQVACRACGWRARDPMRRRLASRFRFHLQGEPRETAPGAD